MKSNFLRLFFLTLLITGVTELMAQGEFPEPGKYRLDTLRNKKWSYQLNLAAGAFIDAEGGSLNPTLAGPYIYGRYNLFKRIVFSASGSVIPMKIGNVDLSQAFFMEGRTAIIFKKSVDAGGENFKLGNDGEYKYSANVPVASGTLTGITGSLGISRRIHTENKDSSPIWTLYNTRTDSVNYLPKVVSSVFVQTISAGFYISRSVNFKGRFFLTTNSGLQRRMVRRRRTTLDMAAEMIFAPVINVSKNPIMVNGNGDSSNVNRFELRDVQKKRMGWRVQVYMRKGILAYYFEMGGRPGVYFNINDVPKAENKWYAAPFNGFYMRMGIGIGIGFINQN